MNDSEVRAAVANHFSRHSGRVRRARLLRFALTGLTLGLLATALLLVARFYLAAESGSIPWSALVFSPGPIGLVCGLFVGQRHRWSDEEVALFLDARASSGDVISSALSAEATSLSGTVARHALRSLTGLGPLRPRIWERHHWALPAFFVAALPLLVVHPKAATITQPPPGAELLTMETLPGLKELESLTQLDAMDPAEAKRLAELLDQAKELERRLQSGMEQREAQASIAKLRDDVDALLGELANAENRAGLAAAVEALRKGAATQKAAEALGNADLVRFDEEMRKLATAAERDAREQAKQALEEALQAAKTKGARAVSSALREQRKNFELREHTQDLLRRIGSALPSEAQSALERASSNDLDEQQMQQLTDALEKALGSLSEEERKALGERLRKAIERGELNDDPQLQGQAQRLAENFEKGQGHQELRDLLRQMAKPGGDAERLQRLRSAEDGLHQAQQRAAGVLPVPQSGPQQPGGRSQSSRSSGENGGPGEGPGRGEHAGSTDKVEGQDLRAQARPDLNPAFPLQNATQGRTPAQAGERAITPLGSPLSGTSAEELRGVEHSTVPEEYREQVSRYFAP